MADNVFLSRRQLFLAAPESTYATDAAPQHTSSGHPYKIIDPIAIDLGQEHVEVTGGNLTRGFSRPIGTVRPAGVTMRTFVTGIDTSTYTAAIKPPIANLLRACGLYETFVSSNADGDAEYQYAPAADVGSDSSVTIVAHQDGFEHRLVGCRGNVNFIFQAANPVIAEFNFRGQLTTEASTTRGTPTGFVTIQPARWVDSGTFYMDSWTAHVENLNFNTNNQILEQRASIAASGSGILAVLITERSPGGSFDPEATEPSTFNFFSAWRNSSGSVMRLQAGTTKGNRFSIIASQSVLKQVGWGDNTGLSLFNTDYQAYERSGNDEYLLRFT